jgi:extracellular matrix protein 14
MYARNWLIVWCLVLLAGQVPAVPAGSSITPPPPLEPVQFIAQTSTPRRPWSRLRDSIIEAIWRVPKNKQGYGTAAKDTLRGGLPSKKVLTRYGSDVVLRFELRDSEEVQALADAVNILFLDVWDSTDEFVDIRLAKEIVSVHGLVQLTSCSSGINDHRFPPC